VQSGGGGQAGPRGATAQLDELTAGLAPAVDYGERTLPGLFVAKENATHAAYLATELAIEITGASSLYRRGELGGCTARAGRRSTRRTARRCTTSSATPCWVCGKPVAVTAALRLYPMSVYDVY
jgi:hypothetical protein